MDELIMIEDNEAKEAEAIENDELSDRCLNVIRKDIKEAKSYGMDCDKAQWLKLLNRIEEVI